MAKKIISILLCAALITVMFAGCKSSVDTDASVTEASQANEFVQPVYSNKAGSVKKSETVYVNIDSSGKKTGISVTDWIHTDKAEVVVDDISGLDGITNLKSDIMPVIGKDGIQWNMDTTDLYYSGTTDKELPVDISIKYYLDGKELTADKIAGASGNVKIDVTMTNKCFAETSVNGVKHTVYLPVIVAGIAILPETGYSNAKVTNGTLIGDGSKEIAVMLGMPGMNESLELSKETLENLSGMDLSGHCSVTADTTSFELGNLYFAVLPICSMDFDMIVPDNVEDLSVNLQKLKKVLDSAQSLEVNDVLSLLVSDSDKISELTGMINDAAKLYSSNEALIKVLSKYLTEENLAAVEKLVKDMDESSMTEAIELLSNPILQAFFRDLPTLIDDVEELTPVINALNEDLKDEEVQASLDALPETLLKLGELQKQLDENKELISALGELVSSENVDIITELAEELSGFDVGDIVSKYGDTLSDTDMLVARAKEWISFGNEYRIFTEAAESAETSVVFVYRTESISAAVSSPAKEDATEAEQPWFKKLLGK